MISLSAGTKLMSGAGRAVDLRGGRRVTIEPPVLEWSQRVVGTDFIIPQGVATWSNFPLNTTTPMVALPDATVSFSEAADGDARWLYVECVLDTAAPSATPTLGENDYFPVDDPGAKIVRFRLSKWTFTKGSAEGSKPVATRVSPIAGQGGAIQLTGVGLPP